MLLHQLLWSSIIFALLWQSSSVGRKKRKCSTIQGTHDAVCIDVADIDPTDRSREDWESLNHEGLVLACDQAHILATGSSRVLVNRLVEFYHPPTTTGGDEQQPIINTNRTSSSESAATQPCHTSPCW